MAASVPIIPLPSQHQGRKGSFPVTRDVGVVSVDGEAKGAARFLLDQIRQRLGPAPERGRPLRRAQPGRIHLARSDRPMPDEAYRLTITPDRIEICAASASGFFYAAQSLLQYVDAALRRAKSPRTRSPLRIACMEVEDAPRFAWRGLMLDESRHFFGKQVVLQLLDEMAYLKLNRLHWHLTDEPAWRLPIRKYPRLTRVGGRGSWSDRHAPRKAYTQQQIRQIVRYAAERHILIVPEIDMPAHATAASRAYPELGAPGEGRWNGFTFHPGRASTYRFLSDVIRETTELFPGPYVHIGGDEVHFGNQSWSTDPQILRFARRKQLHSPQELEHYFLRRMAGVVARLGRRTASWDETVDAGLDPSTTTIMWWRHDKPAQLDRALSEGFSVVLCPRRPLYFDFVQHASHRHGRRWEGFNPLEDVYRFPESLPNDPGRRAGQILGLQACLWTERVADTGRLHFMLFPRLAALAEAGWTRPDRKEPRDFRRRVRLYLRHLDEVGVHYFNAFAPRSTPEPVGPDKPDRIAEG